MPNSRGDLEHDLAGDAAQAARGDGRREEIAALEDENIVAGAFGDEALLVEHQALAGAGLVGLDLGQDVVEVIERLDLRAQRAGRDAARAAGDDVEAALVKLLGVKRDAGGDDDDARALGSVSGFRPRLPMPRVTTRRM